MDESWKTSLMTGDQCAICEQPLDDDAVEIEEQGQLMQVCGACAIQRGDSEPAEPSRQQVLRQARGRADIIAELVEHRREEETQLLGLREFLERMAEALAESTERIEELEEQLRSAREELGRLQQQQEKAQRAAAAATTAPGENVAPQFPAPASSLALEPAEGFTLEELREVQRIFNESEFTEKLRSVRRSLGHPIVHLDPVSRDDGRNRVLVTVAWEIVWYQFLLDLAAETEEPVVLFAEGMELDELSERFHQGNAILDAEGRIDASELEYELVKEEGQVISDESPEQAALEDATEEIWDRHSSPEFRWDD